jgi:hypothetical protein
MKDERYHLGARITSRLQDIIMNLKIMHIEVQKYGWMCRGMENHKTEVENLVAM